MTTQTPVASSLISVSSEVQWSASEEKGMLTIDLRRAVVVGGQHYDIKIVRPVVEGNTQISADEIQKIQEIYRAVFSAICTKRKANDLTPDRITLSTSASHTDVWIDDGAAKGQGSAASNAGNSTYRSRPFSAQIPSNEDIDLLSADITQIKQTGQLTIHDALLLVAFPASRQKTETDSTSSSNPPSSVTPPSAVSHITASTARKSAPIRFTNQDRTPDGILKYLDGMPEGRGMMTRFCNNSDRHARVLRGGFDKLLKDPESKDKEAVAARVLLDQWFKHLCEFWKGHKDYVEQTKSRPAQEPQIFACNWLDLQLANSTQEQDLGALDKLMDLVSKENFK